MNEFFYAFYLLSGHFDSLLAVNGIDLGVDLGVVSSVVLLFLLIINILFHSKIKVPVNFGYEFVILLLILTLAGISLFYTKSPSYGKFKTLFFAKEIILSFAFPFFVYKFDVKRFVKWFVAILFIFTLIYIYELQILPYSNELVYKRFVARYLEIGIANGVVFLIMIFSKQNIYRTDIMQFIVAFLALVFLVLSSARGPAVFLILILTVVFTIRGLSIKIKRTWLVYSFFVIFISLPFVVYVFMSNPKYMAVVNNLLARTIMRFSKFIGFITGSGFDESAFDRILMWRFALDKIFERISTVLFGYGIGSFGILYLGQDIRAYPHNIFLEAWFELGFIALVLFVLFFAIPLIQGRKNPYISSAVIYYLLLNILKSYSFVDMRVVYVFMAMFIFPYVKDKFDTRSKPSVIAQGSQ